MDRTFATYRAVKLELDEDVEWPEGARCMKFKSKSRHHNYKLRVRWFKETLGLIAMVDILLCKGM